MKRELILIRHAKSAWDDPSLRDFDRPLNERGLRDAPKMAEHIHSQVPAVNLLLCSTAKRAKMTAKFFAEQWELQKNQVMYLDELYHASANTIEQVIRSVDNGIEVLALTGHNPGLTEVINLIPHVQLDNLPTCGVYRANVPEDWSQFRFRNIDHRAIVYPKMLPHD